MSTWPVTLPQRPLLSGYSQQRPAPVIEAPVDGPSLSRRRYTAAPMPISLSFVMSAAQYATWAAFYTSTIASGALPFTATTVTALGPGEYRIVGSPVEELIDGGKWRISMNWIRLP